MEAVEEGTKRYHFTWAWKQEKLETDFPGDTYLHVFTYQMAQWYWIYLHITENQQYRVPFTKWMNKTIEPTDGKDTFYSNIAKQLLKQNIKVS